MDYKNLFTHMREQIKLAFRGEVDLLREILSNLYQEELCLRAKDKRNWEQLMQERHLMIQRLGSLRKERIETTEKLENLSPFTKKGGNQTLQQLLSLDDETYSQILLLRDQCLALMERINFQSHFNHDLFYRFEKNPGEIEPQKQENPALHLKKNRLATYDINSHDE